MEGEALLVSKVSKEEEKKYCNGQVVFKGGVAKSSSVISLSC